MADTENEWSQFEDPGIGGLYIPGTQPPEKTPNHDARRAEIIEIRSRVRLQALEWRDAAVADGWSIETYYDHEPLDHACRLRRDGYLISMTTRPCPSPDGFLPFVTMSCWGEDGAVVRLPVVYNMAEIVAGYRTCSNCGATDVDTTRVAFATRCCLECAPKVWASLPKNWCD